MCFGARETIACLTGSAPARSACASAQLCNLQGKFFEGPLEARRARDLYREIFHGLEAPAVNHYSTPPPIAPGMVVVCWFESLISLHIKHSILVRSSGFWTLVT